SIVGASEIAVNWPATPRSRTPSLHDALPICGEFGLPHGKRGRCSSHRRESARATGAKPPGPRRESARGRGGNPLGAAAGIRSGPRRGRTRAHEGKRKAGRRRAEERRRGARHLGRQSPKSSPHVQAKAVLHSAEGDLVSGARVERGKYGDEPWMAAAAAPVSPLVEPVWNVVAAGGGETRIRRHWWRCVVRCPGRPSRIWLLAMRARHRCARVFTGGDASPFRPHQWRTISFSAPPVAMRRQPTG